MERLARLPLLMLPYGSTQRHFPWLIHLAARTHTHTNTDAAEWHRQDAHNSSCAHGTRLSSAPLRSGSVRFVQPVERAQLSQLAVLLHAIVVVVVVVCRLILTAMQGDGGREEGREGAGDATLVGLKFS